MYCVTTSYRKFGELYILHTCMCMCMCDKGTLIIKIASSSSPNKCLLNIIRSQQTAKIHQQIFIVTRKKGSPYCLCLTQGSYLSVYCFLLWRNDKDVRVYCEKLHYIWSAPLEAGHSFISVGICIIMSISGVMCLIDDDFSTTKCICLTLAALSH